MMQLHQDYAKFLQNEIEILVIGPEKSDAFKKLWEKHNLPFTGLPDPEHKVLKMYGQEVKIFKLGRMPAQMLIDKKGILRFVHYGHSMKDIPSTEEVLSSLNNE